MPDGISLPRLRENGTVRDLDTLVCSPDGDVIDAHGKVIGEEMTISVFGLRPYRDNKRGLLDFVGGRYVDSNGNLFWRLNGIETSLPEKALNRDKLSVAIRLSVISLIR